MKKKASNQEIEASINNHLNSIKSHIKSISGILVSAGVAGIMGNVMKEYKPDTKGVQKILIKLGAAALTGMVIKSATEYVDGEIDDIFDTAVEFAKKTNQKEEEVKDDDADD